MTTRAVVLARGLGRRMQQEDPGVELSEAQRRAADAGLKGLMPIGNHPFLDYVLSALADAGIERAALVIGPDHREIRRYYGVDRPPQRLAADFVVQDEALGTADAVLAAQKWTGGEPFLVVNSDNLYSTDDLRRLASLDEPGLPAFDRTELVRTSNIPEERVRSFAVIEIEEGGYLSGIVEKPAASLPAVKSPAAISMNCWRFDGRIFEYCRTVPRSPRGEFELPEAVGVAVRAGIRFKTFPASGPVLDLSRRLDAPAVARRLAAVTPRP